MKEIYCNIFKIIENYIENIRTKQKSKTYSILKYYKSENDLNKFLRKIKEYDPIIFYSKKRYYDW